MPDLELLKAIHSDVYPAVDPAAGLKHAAESRSILVTGAGTGVGKAIAKAFAQASARTVVLVGRRLEVLEKTKLELQTSIPDCDVLTIAADVSKTTDVDNLFSNLTAQNIEIDVLINNAGINSEYASIRESDPEKWWQNWEVMLKGPYLMTRAWLRARKSKSPAAVIMTSSIGSYLTSHDMSSYSSVKTALNRITEFIAQEERSNGVQAIAFHPGGVANTDLTSKSPEWLKEYFIDTPELGAGTALYLSTPKAAWLSGHYVDARWDTADVERTRSKIEEEDLLKSVVLGCARITHGPDSQ